MVWLDPAKEDIVSTRYGVSTIYAVLVETRAHKALGGQNLAAFQTFSHRVKHSMKLLKLLNA
jgi:hypothetical protein